MLSCAQVSKPLEVVKAEKGSTAADEPLRDEDVASRIQTYQARFQPALLRGCCTPFLCSIVPCPPPSALCCLLADWLRSLSCRTCIQAAVSTYTSVARRLLHRYHGYECKEPEPGKFTLAFQ